MDVKQENPKVGDLAKSGQLVDGEACPGTPTLNLQVSSLEVPSKGHKQMDTDLGRSVYPSVFGQVPQKLPRDEDLYALEILRNGSQEKAVERWGNRTGWKRSQVGA